MSSSSTAMTMSMAAARSPLFTVSQWHELEHQALILKYLLAGMPVPPDLLFPIQKSFESLSSRFFPSASLGYCSFYGKKVDPEPGRCRRTDGKKWRCSKDAYGDSKYCERHMHRGRNRSRKPVEPSQTTTSSQSPLSAAVSSVTVMGDNNYSSSSISGGGGGGAAVGHYQNLPLNTFGNSQELGPATTDQSQLHLENIPYGIPHKDYRYLYGLKADVGEHSFFSEASGKSLQIDSSLDSSWSLASSQVSLFPTSKASDYSMLQNDYPHNSFSGNEFGTGSDPAKQSGNSIRPFFEDLSKNKGTWPSDLENEISRRSSLSSTQLSISIPMGSSDLSGTSSRSPA